MQAKEKLLNFVAMMNPLTKEEQHHFSAHWQPISFGKKQIITAAEEQEQYLYFVVSGVQRIYYLDDEGKEATLVFTYAPSFGGVLDSMMLKSPSRYYYETLTETEMLRLPTNKLFELTKQYYGIQQLVLKGLSAATSGIMLRLVELQCLSSEQRFRNLFQRSPHILQLVPQKYLANYLGIDATNFSKLMNKVKL